MHIINSIKTVFYVIFFSFFVGFLVERQLVAEGFLHGTQVKTPIGYVAIEELQVNDFVMCCDAEWSFVERAVIALHKKRFTHYVKIIVGAEFICVAVDQKFYIPQEQIWCEARYLVPGDMLLSSGLTLMTIDDVVNVDEEAMVYDITVDGYHNFCVSSYDIHVHNVIPAIAFGLSWVFGMGAIEFTGATLAVAGAAIGLTLSRKNDKQKAEISIGSGFGGQGNNNSSEDPDDKKQKRDDARNNHHALTNKEARQKAQELGYKEAKNPPFNPHGKPAFRKGNNWISPDKDGHNGGVWKRFLGRQREGRII